MCTTCGCDHDSHEGLSHEEMHRMGIAHDHHHEHERIHRVEQDILSKNNLAAERNRGYFEAKEIICFNLVSSPGSGKTTLLERTFMLLKDKLPLYVIEGDQQTTNDTDRIKATGVPCLQINTQNGCHLDASMVHKALHELNPQGRSLLFIENVGNLVCPALFDLGEKERIVVISVTEGDDKPLKYPYMFESADICIINKIDLLPYVDSDIERIRNNALKINPRLKFFEISASKGDGMEEWCDYLQHLMKKNYV
ncbi:hydrogenase nickel incorporation protein HypB [Coprobacter tertius]|uniref:hydrogenase nickel incorporation protein HypB n=1 Tax=Coprobacter tertius TaxID=2944915 RepID=UPI003F498640